MPETGRVSDDKDLDRNIHLGYGHHLTKLSID